MTAMPGVPAEAVRLGAAAAGTYEFVVEKILAAALPSLREVIAADVLGPVRALVREWGEMQPEEIDQYALWQRLQALSTPVQGGAE